MELLPRTLVPRIYILAEETDHQFKADTRGLRVEEITNSKGQEGRKAKRRACPTHDLILSFGVPFLRWEYEFRNG